MMILYRSAYVGVCQQQNATQFFQQAPLTSNAASYANTTPPVAPQPVTPPYKACDKRQILAFVGCALLLFGVFAPLIRIPVVGSINYMHGGRGDGVIVLLLAVVSLIFTLIRKFKWLWATGAACAIIPVFTLTLFTRLLSGVKSKDNDFGDLALNLVQLEWGWALLFLGAALIIAAAAVKEQ